RINARISSLRKSDSNLLVYITDVRGKVIYDSLGQSVGQDYSRWNDVYLTLRGEYGARTTRSHSDDPNTSVMYVAAPIKVNSRIIGVVSVGKPSSSVQPYFDSAVRNIETKVLILLLASLAAISFIVYWLTLSIRKLTMYAHGVQQGKRTPVPELREKELAQLAHAMEAMRISLEGKDYVEQYLHSLTHELKSPLAAIRGAAELLQEEIPEQARQRFVRNINNQSLRLSQVVEQLLRLASVEKRQQLQDIVGVDSAALVRQLCDDKAAMCEQKNISFDFEGFSGTSVAAEHFLLQQAISNIIDNAIAFSSAEGVIYISDNIDEDSWTLYIRDQGPGIPDYAQARIFERFYSLPRPDSGLKSTGLGLSLVQEVAQLHHGKVRMSNSPQGGTLAALQLPLKQ
ncbi:MAG: two-component system sensor histidine kinase CreC, partial [Gammaproteobacteria bacterium]|nr:two-component system sensor histidine kinase CreC [Gammaproteobacteria bacterium]